jgi:3-oxoacyl-[acyl-carrier-protein] synthase-3
MIPWRDIEPAQLINDSVFALKQDSRLLEKHITDIGASFLKDLITKGLLKDSEIDYLLPHMSSEFFRNKIKDSLLKYNIEIEDSKWFTNLDKIGNIGAASGFMMLEELFYSGKLKKGDRILLMVPESARFSYTYAHFTVV